MMVIEAPVIIYLKDGTIDTASSYVMIQDQQTGGSSAHREEIDDVKIQYCGRISAKYTFDELYEKNYIPVTAAEFIGEKPYDKAVVNVSDPNCNSMNALADLTVDTNYPLAVINLINIDEKGNKTILGRTVFGGTLMQGVPRTYKISEMDGFEYLSPAAGSKIQLEVVVSTGERFYPIEFAA